jgi:hypothetical protein
MNALMMFDYDGVISVQQIDGTSHEHLGLIFFQQNTSNLQMISTKGKEH